MVARSSEEAEFRVMALGICELLWKIVFTDFKVKTQVPMMVYCDNKVTINIAYNLVHHDKTKHLEIDQHFIKEKMDSEQICTPYVPSTKQLADFLTKGLLNSIFHQFFDKLGMQNIFASA